MNGAISEGINQKQPGCGYNVRTSGRFLGLDVQECTF